MIPSEHAEKSEEEIDKEIRNIFENGAIEIRSRWKVIQLFLLGKVN